MRKNLQTLMWTGLGLVVAAYLTQYAQLIPQPTVGASDFYWVFMGALAFLANCGSTVGSVLFAGALLIHFGLDRRGADPGRGAQRPDADLPAPEAGGAV